MRLKVFRVEKVCFFELAWGQGQQMTAQMTYPETLTQLYADWQLCYLDFYRTSLRGRIKNSGTLSAAPIDYRSRLVSAEAAFLAEFYDWLKSRELLDIRSKIAHLSQQSQQSGTDLFLTCEPLALARFPWEVWEILGEFGQRSSLRIIRTPANLRHQPTQKARSGKMRMLVILGDETGLSFQSEITALKSLERFAEVQFEGWHVGESIAGLKERIAQRLVDPIGWDILFFAGHSNESVLTGGELAIAPQTSIFLKEIQPQLLKAKENGLQFAIFNSCKGLDLANTLIDLGLSQVAIMREPIHNSVAQDFLIQFIQHLMPGEDRESNREPNNVYQALDHACQYLKLDRNLTYPSAYFIPSFFCHPETQPFTPRILGVQQKLRSLLPSRRQTIALATIAFATALTPLQELLLDGRLMSQAIYRQVTHQVPAPDGPKIRIVQIDNESIKDGLIRNRQYNPIDRLALAKIVDGISLTSPKVLAIDYLLDRPMPGDDEILAKSLSKAQNKGISLVFGSDVQGAKSLEIASTLRNPLEQKSTLEKSTQARNGYIGFYSGYQASAVGCPFSCPFGLATADEYCKALSNQSPLNLNPDWRSVLQNSGITAFSPIIDFSIPSDRVYVTSSAMKAVGFSSPNDSPEPIVILAAGDYADAGLNANDKDKFSAPGAWNYWRFAKGQPTTAKMTGAEIHAYMIHHALNRRHVTPIPDLLMVGLAAIVGSWFQARRRSISTKPSPSWNIFLTAAIYGGISLQAFISASVLLPWLWPSLTLWLYQSPRLNPAHLRKRLP